MNNLPQQQQTTEIQIESVAYSNIEQMLHISSVLARSTIIPKDFQGNEGNCFVVLQLASRLGIDPFTMLQNVDVVYGRAGIRGSFARALVKSRTRGLVGDGFETRGELPANFKGFDASKSNFELRYYVEKADYRTGEITKVFGPWIGPALAKEMGWWDKAGSFWAKAPSMCERMCKFRAVSWYVKDEDPNILAGLPLAEELHDYDPIDVTPAKEPTAAQKAFSVAPTASEEAPKTESEITPDAAKALKDYATQCGYKLIEVIPAVIGREVKAISELTKAEFSSVEQWLEQNKKS